MSSLVNDSGLPEQEPTSPTVAVLCDGATWVNTAMGWESLTQWLGAWGDLRDFAAEKGGATLFDLAYLPTGLTGAQKEAIRSAEATLAFRGHDVSAGVLRDAFPEVFADDHVSATWEFGDSDESRNELLRVARMEGAFIVAEKGGVKITGRVDHIRTPPDFIRIGYCEWEFRLADDPGWMITVTAPKPVEPGADIPDEAVDAALDSFMNALDGHERPKGLKVRNFMRAALATADAKRAELAGGAA